MKPEFLRQTLAAALASGALAASHVVAQAGVLAPHRAVYDLALGEAETRSGISGIYGRMVYEVRGSACEGYAVRFRFMTRVDTEEFTRITDQQTTTFEDPEKGTFRFSTRSFVDEVLDQETRGQAIHRDGGVSVDLARPVDRDFRLDAGHFPTEHMLEMIEKAEAGETFYQSHVFDGSEEGDRLMLTTAVIGAPRMAAADDPETQAAGRLSKARYWPVTVAYFNESGSGDETPDYQISFKLHANGVTRDMTMDYGDFSLRGRLSDLTFFEPSDCEARG